MMGLAVVVGYIIVNGFLFSYQIVYGFITAFLLTAASMVINDYYDREIDALNRPDRPIPKGLMNPREALIYGFILSGVGLVAAFLIGPIASLLALTFFALSVLYNTRGKKLGLLGNAMVATCVTAPIIYGGILVEVKANILSLVFASMVFLSTMGREVTKGIADVAGDKARGARTLPILIGVKRAAYVAVLFYVLAVSLSPIPLVFGLVKWPYAPIVLLSDAGFIVLSISLLMDHSKKNANRIKAQVLIIMLVGLIGFMVGTLYG